MMKIRSSGCRSGRILLITASLVVLIPGMALAAAPEWRPTYDLAMRWVNFIILAAVIVKYGRKPIKTFLNQQKQDVVAEIDRLEVEKRRIIDDINSAKAQTEENQQKLEAMKTRLVDQGQNRKAQIVEQAHRQGAAMIEETRRKMENRILQAKDKLKMELADMAFSQAIEKLPHVISDADNQRLLDIYMQGMHLEQELP